MEDFKQREILSGGSELIKLLRETRERRGLSLQAAAQKTGINLKYLASIESGDFSALPEGLYARNYIRQYAVFLGFDDNDLFHDFEKEKIEPGKFSKAELFSRKVPNRQLFITIPRIIKNSLVITAVLLCLAYLLFSLLNIISPPKLVISSPDQDITVATAEFIISGQTEREAEVYINNDLVLIDREGFFNKPIDLKKGVNVITIVSEKKYSKKSVIERKIILD